MIDKYKELEFLPRELFLHHYGKYSQFEINRNIVCGVYVPIGTINYKECLGDVSDAYMHGSTVLFRTDVRGRFEDRLYIEPNCDVIYMNADKSDVMFAEKKKRREQDLLRDESKQYGKVISLGENYDRELKNNSMKLARKTEGPSTFNRVDVLCEIIQTEIVNPDVSIEALHALKAVYHNCYYMLGHTVTDYAKAHLDEVKALIVSEMICAESGAGLRDFSTTCKQSLQKISRIVDKQYDPSKDTHTKQTLLNEFVL